MDEESDGYKSKSHERKWDDKITCDKITFADRGGIMTMGVEAIDTLFVF